MRTQVELLGALLLGLLVPLHVTGQDRSVEAAVANLQTHDRPADASLFFFHGCPQEDPLGRAIFEAVRDIEIRPYERVSLARIFARGTYPTCEYAPLNRWIAELFRQLHADGLSGPALNFANGLGPLIDEDLQDALLDAAEDASFGGPGTRRNLVDAALQHRPPERQVEEVIAALGRNLEGRPKTTWVYQMSRGRGAEFYTAHAAAAPNLPDDALQRVADAINGDIQDGRVDPDTPGLAELRRHVQGRGLEARYQIRTRPVTPR